MRDVIEGKISHRSFILANFEINKTDLKPAHQKRLKQFATFIKTESIPFTSKWLVRLIGSASQSGKESYNEWLSEARARSVEAELTKLIGIAPVEYRIIGLGETSPIDAAIFENPRDRAVGVIATLFTLILPPPPPPPLDIGELTKPRTPEPKVFEFQMIALEWSFSNVLSKGPKGIGGGIGAGSVEVNMNFTVKDDKFTVSYNFKGNGWQGGISAPVAGGKAKSIKKGKVQKFKASKHLTALDFEGDGRYQNALTLDNVFTFGGEKSKTTKGVPRPKDYPMGLIWPVDTNLASAGEYFFDASGKVKKGFDPKLKSRF